MAVFASHAYDASWRVAPLGVPLAVAVVWAAVITSAMAVAGATGANASRGGAAVTAALVAIALDLMIEPVATRAGPLALDAAGPVAGRAHRQLRRLGRDRRRVRLRRGALGGDGPHRDPGPRGASPSPPRASSPWCWSASSGRRSASSARSTDGRGWIVWAAVLVATLWRDVVGASRARESSGSRRTESSLPARLAATPGRGPEAVLCVVGLAFAVEALRIAEPGVTVAAVGSLATIGIVAAGTSSTAAGSGRLPCQRRP